MVGKIVFNIIKFIVPYIIAKELPPMQQEVLDAYKSLIEDKKLLALWNDRELLYDTYKRLHLPVNDIKEVENRFALYAIAHSLHHFLSQVLEMTVPMIADQIKDKVTKLTVPDFPLLDKIIDKLTTVPKDFKDFLKKILKEMFAYEEKITTKDFTEAALRDIETLIQEILNNSGLSDEEKQKKLEKLISDLSSLNELFKTVDPIRAAIYLGIQNCLNRYKELNKYNEIADGKNAPNKKLQVLEVEGALKLTVKITPGTLTPLPDNRIAYHHSHKGIVKCDLESGAMMKQMESSPQLPSMLRILSYIEPSYLISGYDDGTLLIWNINTGAMIEKVKEHTAKINRIIDLIDGRFATASDDKTVKVWQIEKNKCKCELTLAHDSPVTALVYSSDDQQLISGTAHGLIKVWDTFAGQCSKTINIGKFAICNLALLPNMRIACESKGNPNVDDPNAFADPDDAIWAESITIWDLLNNKLWDDPLYALLNNGAASPITSFHGSLIGTIAHKIIFSKKGIFIADTINAEITQVVKDVSLTQRVLYHEMVILYGEYEIQIHSLWKKIKQTKKQDKSKPSTDDASDDQKSNHSPLDEDAALNTKNSETITDSDATRPWYTDNEINLVTEQKFKQMGASDEDNEYPDENGRIYNVFRTPAVDTQGKAHPISYFLDKSKQPSNALLDILRITVRPNLPVLTPMRANKTVLTGHLAHLLRETVAESDRNDTIEKTVIPLLESANFNVGEVDKKIVELEAQQKNEQWDVFDKIKALFSEDEANIKLLFPYNKTQSHWLTAEILIHKKGHNYEIMLTAHDPFGNGSIEKNNYDDLCEAIRKQIKSIDKDAQIQFKSITSQYSARQNHADDNSCGIIVCEDLVNRTLGVSLGEGGPYPIGATKLRRQHTQLVLNHLPANDESRQRFLQTYGQPNLNSKSSLQGTAQPHANSKKQGSEYYAEDIATLNAKNESLIARVSTLEQQCQQYETTIQFMLNLLGKTHQIPPEILNLKPSIKTPVTAPVTKQTLTEDFEKMLTPHPNNPYTIHKLRLLSNNCAASAAQYKNYFCIKILDLDTFKVIATLDVENNAAKILRGSSNNYICSNDLEWMSDDELVHNLNDHLVSWHIKNELRRHTIEDVSQLNTPLPHYNKGDTIFKLLRLSDKFLIAGHASGLIQMVDITNGTQVKKFVGNTGITSYLGILPNGNLITATRDGIVNIWSIPTCTNLRTFKFSTGVTSIVSLSVNRCAAASYDGNLQVYTVNICNIETGECEKTIKGNYKCTIEHMLLDEKDNLICVYGDQGKVIFDVFNPTSGQMVETVCFPINDICSGTISTVLAQNGTFLVGNNGNIIVLRNTFTRQLREGAQPPSPVITQIITELNMPAPPADQPQPVVVVAAPKNQNPQFFQQPKPAVYSSNKSYQKNMSTTQIMVSNADNLVTYLQQGIIQIWNINTGSCLRTIHDPKRTTGINCLKLLNKNRLLTTRKDVIYIWNMESGEFITMLSLPKPASAIYSVEVLPNNRIICVTGSQLYVLDIESSNCAHTTELPEDAFIHYLHALPSNRLLSASAKTIKIWTDYGNRCRTAHSFGTSCLEIISTDTIAIVPLTPGTSNNVATREIKIINIYSGECIQTLSTQDRLITSLQRLSENRLVSLAEGGNARIWDLKTGTCIGVLNAGNSDSTQFLRLKVVSEDEIIAVNGDGDMKSWKLSQPTADTAPQLAPAP